MYLLDRWEPGKRIIYFLVGQDYQVVLNPDIQFITYKNFYKDYEDAKHVGIIPYFIKNLKISSDRPKRNIYMQNFVLGDNEDQIPDTKKDIQDILHQIVNFELFSFQKISVLLTDELRSLDNLSFHIIGLQDFLESEAYGCLP